MPLELSVQWMQIPAGCGHIARLLRPAEQRELQIQLARVAGLNSRLAAGEEELLDAGVAEAPDHTKSVTLHDTHCKEAILAK